MLYRYKGKHAVAIPHGIGTKLYHFGDIIESEVPLSKFGVPEGRYEIIPTNKEEPVIKQEISKKEFEIKEANQKLEEAEENFDNQLQAMKNNIKKLEDEKKQIEAKIVKETKKITPKASKSKKEEVE